MSIWSRILTAVQGTCHSKKTRSHYDLNKPGGKKPPVHVLQHVLKLQNEENWKNWKKRLVSLLEEIST